MSFTLEMIINGYPKVLLPIGILGRVRYLIVSIPDLCTITYFGIATLAARQ